MDTNFYDVVICGPDLAGVVAAALLCRRGFRVLLLGHDADLGSFEIEGQQLGRGPGLLPPIDSQPVTRILKELNYMQVARRRAPVLSPALQLVLPRHRLELGMDAEDLGRELQREFPAERSTLESVLDRMASVSNTLEPLLGSETTLPPDGFWERREVGRLESLLPRRGTDILAPLPPDHPMRAALNAPAVLGTDLAAAENSAVAVARSMDLSRRGFQRIEGGTAGLRRLFLEKFRSFSGEVREKAFPVEVLFRHGRASGVRVRPRDETIGCSYLVWADSMASLAKLCGDRVSRKMREGAAAMRPVAYRYTVAMLIEADGIPDGMGPRVIAIADPSRPLMEENAMAISLGEPAPQSPGTIPLWIETLVPAPAVDTGPGYLGALRARLKAQLARTMPFYERHLVAVASAHDGLAPELPERNGEPAAPPPIVPMAPIYGTELSRALDVGGLQNATGIKHLYLAGRENLPGLATEGELVAAWGVARLITAAHPKRDLLRREVLLSET